MGLVLQRYSNNLKKAIWKLFNHKLSIVIQIFKSKEIPGILRVSSFLLRLFFFFFETFLMGNFDVAMENNLNDNVFCKNDSFPQLCLWKILHPNHVLLTTLINALLFSKKTLLGVWNYLEFWWYICQVSKILRWFFYLHHSLWTCNCIPGKKKCCISSKSLSVRFKETDIELQWLTEVYSEAQGLIIVFPCPSDLPKT